MTEPGPRAAGINAHLQKLNQRNIRLMWIAIGTYVLIFCVAAEVAFQIVNGISKGLDGSRMAMATLKYETAALESQIEGAQRELRDLNETNERAQENFDAIEMEVGAFRARFAERLREVDESIDKPRRSR